MSRHLGRAKARGIVEIVVHDADESQSAMEVEIEKRFGLRECIVTPSLEREENTLRAMGPAVGRLLSRVLRPGELFGVSWGETLKAIADAVTIERPIDVGVVPIIGAMGQMETGIYPNAIAGRFAQKLGGRSFLVNAPAVLDSEATRDSILNDRNFVAVREWWSTLSAAIVSVSSLSPDASVARYEVFSAEELGRIQNAGVVCATNFNFIDAQGTFVDTEFDRRMIKLNLDELRGLHSLIVVAVGSRKVAPIRAALSGGFVDILVVDRDTAEAVLADSCESPGVNPFASTGAKSQPQPKTSQGPHQSQDS